jgi:hypothetical protein
MSGKNLKTLYQNGSFRLKFGGVIVVTYSCRFGNYHKAIEAAFHNSVTIDASKNNIHKLIASGKIKSHVAAGTTVIIVASITGNDVIKDLEKALAPVLCVSRWVHCGVAEDLASINLGQGRSIVSKWHALLKTFPHKVVPPSLAGDSLPPITDFEFLRFEPEPFEDLLQQIVSTPVPPITKVSVVIVPVPPDSDWPGKSWVGLTYYASLGFNVLYLDGNDPKFVTKFWAKLNDCISVLPLFGKDYIIVCSKPSHFGSYWEMKRSYDNLRTPLGRGVFLVTNPYDKDSCAILSIMRKLNLLMHLNDCGAPNFSGASSHSSAPSHSNMQEVD